MLNEREVGSIAGDDNYNAHIRVRVEGLDYVYAELQLCRIALYGRGDETRINTLQIQAARHILPSAVNLGEVCVSGHE